MGKISSVIQRLRRLTEEETSSENTGVPEGDMHGKVMDVLDALAAGSHDEDSAKEAIAQVIMDHNPTVQEIDAMVQAVEDKCVSMTPQVQEALSRKTKKWLKRGAALGVAGAAGAAGASLYGAHNIVGDHIIDVVKKGAAHVPSFSKNMSVIPQDDTYPHSNYARGHMPIHRQYNQGGF